MHTHPLLSLSRVPSFITHLAHCTDSALLVINIRVDNKILWELLSHVLNVGLELKLQFYVFEIAVLFMIFKLSRNREILH